MHHEWVARGEMGDAPRLRTIGVASGDSAPRDLPARGRGVRRGGTAGCGSTGRGRPHGGRATAERGIRDARVLEAMARVRRHLFVPPDQRDAAYGDHPLPIGFGQTISQPYIVAFMTEALGVRPTDVVLEIGTGSGYQAAILGELAREVYTIEIVAELGERAERTLAELGYRNVHVRVGDGYQGWPDRAPFSRIILTAAPEEIPGGLGRSARCGRHDDFAGGSGTWRSGASYPDQDSGGGDHPAQPPGPLRADGEAAPGGLRPDSDPRSTDPPEFRHDDTAAKCSRLERRSNARNPSDCRGT